MSNTKELCPECGSEKIWSTASALYMVNTGEHYCNYIEDYDKNSPAGCIECGWRGFRRDSREQTR